MKRIAAVAALIVTMLAVPAAAAMASTGGTGHPGQGQTVCPPPYLFNHRPHVRHFSRYRHHHPRRSVLCSVTLPYQPQSQNCPSGYAYETTQSLTFDVASGSSTVYQVSGPTLAAGEEFTWDGTTYTIWSVNPGDSSFTMSAGSSLYVNGGPDITGGAGQLVCSG